VAIVRLSGTLAPSILQQLHGRRRFHWDSHRLYFGDILQAGGEVLDQGLAVWMKSPRSFTGEDVAEFHLHGGSALANLLLQSCLQLGARLANPGEFTLRAFLHGKIDLTQAEAVQQIIQSRSQLAARLASYNLVGHFSAQVEDIRKGLLDWLALLEAEIDFGDEVPGLPRKESQRRCQHAQESVARLLAQGQSGKALADGLRTVILGAPNAGKSTLLNLLLGRPRALVTEVAGTTRDTLEEPLVVGGVSLLLVDTAGLREDSPDRIEQLGMQRTRQEAEQADLILWVVDGHHPDPPDPEFYSVVFGKPHLLILNKADLGPAAWTEVFPQADEVAVSLSLIKAGAIEALLPPLERLVQRVAGHQHDLIRLTQRQWETLLMAQESLNRLAETLEEGLSAEFLALDLRAAAVALGQIQGIDVTEEVLDRIFSTFCLGK